jgi:hypothetical protein
MPLLPLNDPRWAAYRGGYNRAVATNVVPFLTRLASGSVSEDDWRILWDDLHHQGDIGEASYAVVPSIGTWKTRDSHLTGGSHEG